MPGAVSQYGLAFNCPGVPLEHVNLPLKAAQWDGAALGYLGFSRWLSEYKPLQKVTIFFSGPQATPSGQERRLSPKDKEAVTYDCSGSQHYLRLLFSLWMPRKPCYLWLSGPPTPSQNRWGHWDSEKDMHGKYAVSIWQRIFFSFSLSKSLSFNYSKNLNYPNSY